MWRVSPGALFLLDRYLYSWEDVFGMWDICSGSIVSPRCWFMSILKLLVTAVLLRLCHTLCMCVRVHFHLETPEGESRVERGLLDWALFHA